MRLNCLVVLAVAACAASTGVSIEGVPAEIPPRVTLNFDDAWSFFKGDTPGAQSPACDDSAWRKLNLPHDWSIEGPFEQNALTTGAGGYLPSGAAWYRKTFTLPPEAKGKRVFIEFDGVMADSDVYINNAHVGNRPYGYVGFRYDLTDYLTSTGTNILAVRTDTSRQPASRWYTGAGIYRHTRLVIQHPIHLEHGSTFITTGNAAQGRTSTTVRTRVVNQSATPRDIAIRITRFDPDNRPIDSLSDRAVKAIEPGQSYDFTKVVSDPTLQLRLWNSDAPHLYRALVQVLDGNTVLDEQSVSYGIRIAEFRAGTGFWLNGNNIKLRGVALHHDGGAFGAAVPGSVWASRLTALMKLGVNAIRCGHAPMAPEFYNICDRLGLLVMDEAFDAWTVGKEAGDYHLYFKDWWQRDLEAIIKRNRNHPSVVIYSLGNEIWDILPLNPDPAPDANIGPPRPIAVAWNLFLPMRDLAHQLDPTRPLTLAILRPNVAGIYGSGFAELMDVVGQNYRDNELAAAHVQNPERKIIGTENYHERSTWIALRDNPALAGQFLWTGADYLGEARWPNIGSSSGLLDRTNLPKNNAFERESWWSARPVLYVARVEAARGPRLTAPAAANAPAKIQAAAPNVNAPPARPPAMVTVRDWTPANRQPHVETVNIYSNCDEVDLFFNDRSLGTKPLNADASPRQWKIDYQPGTLKAVGKNKGQVVATDELRTAGVPVEIVLEAETTLLPNDWEHVICIRALLQDANGTLNPLASDRITFSVTGPAVIAAVDNGDPQSHESFQANQRSAFHGTCVACVRATANSGEITLTASSEGLSVGVIKLQAAPPAFGVWRH